MVEKMALNLSWLDQTEAFENYLIEVDCPFWCSFESCCSLAVDCMDLETSYCSTDRR